jgi:hypothetical protein
MNSKTQLIKKTIAKINISKIISYQQEYPKSKTLKEIIRYTRTALENNEEEKIFKSVVDLAYNLDTLVNKTSYVRNEEEKKQLLKISEELFRNTIGLKDKNKL